MGIQLTLRQKTNIIVGIVAGAFIFLTSVSHYLDVEMESKTSVIRNIYIPHVELGYRLESLFDGIGLSLRDAVAAQDNNGLELALVSKTKLISELDGASGFVEQQKLTNLKVAIEDYFSTATETSKRLIGRETGLGIVESMTKMQEKRAVAEEMLAKVTAFDRATLRDAFASIENAQVRSAQTRFWVSVSCILIISLVSILMGQALIVRLKEISAGLVRFGEGNFEQIIPIKGRDELSELSGQINEMAARIQSLVGEIESFSYSIAHDLRAPLRSVIGFSAALQEDHAPSFNEEGKSYLGRIHSAAQRMGHMIDGLLNISRVNRAPIRKQPVDLSQIAKGIVEVLKNNEPTRKITVEVDENLVVTGDARLLDMAVSNLISNAWKFTKHTPGARIHIGSKREADAVIIFVADNGAGFDMRYADKLFGTFQRLHKETDFEGHGIGLATVKNIINKHGGRIWAESEPNKGSVFYFVLG